MRIIRTEGARKKYANDVGKFYSTLSKRLKPCVGKKVVLVFRKPVQARKKISRHHCTVEALGTHALVFTPPIRIPRGKYSDLLLDVVWIYDLDLVEIKDPR